ncbi:MAG: oligosaccharide flippase family protein [Niabella sp.]
MSKLLKNTILYSVGEIVPRILSFILLPVYTRYLSPKDYGILSYTNSFVMFLFVVCCLSLNSYLLRHYFDLDKETERKKLIGNVFLFITTINVGILLLSFLIFPPVLSYYNIQVSWKPYFMLAIINNFLEVFTVIPMAVFRIKQQAKNFITLSLSRVLLQAALICYFVVVQRTGVAGYYYGQLIIAGIFLPVYCFIILKNGTINWNFRQIKDGLAFSLPLLPATLSYLIMTLSDRILLERNISLSRIGIYNVAVTLSYALNIIIQSGYKAIEPEIFRQYKTPFFPKFINHTKSIYFAAIYICAMGLSLFSKDFFYYFTSPPFHEGYKLVPYILCGVIMSGENVIYSGILSAEKNTKAIGWATACGGFLSIVLNIIFIPKIGVWSAAFAHAFAFFLMNGMLYLKAAYNGKSMKKELLCLAAFVLFNIINQNMQLIADGIWAFCITTGILFVFIVFILIVYKINVLKLLSPK